MRVPQYIAARFYQARAKRAFRKFLKFESIASRLFSDLDR